MRVLLIEDDSATSQSIELMLKSASFNVYTTDLGEEGIDLGIFATLGLCIVGLGAWAHRRASNFLTSESKRSGNS
jgi:DNA-binding response OmpR family regulator